MRPLALGVFEDLRRRRLIPVVLLLLAALVALPVLMLQKSDPGPVTAPVPAAVSNTADGLPGPREALATNKPLVTLAVLKQSSDLESFEAKNPFKPIDQVSTGGAGTGSVPAVATAIPTAGAPGASTAQTSTGSGSSPGGGGSAGGAPVGGSPTPTGSPISGPPTAPTTPTPPKIPSEPKPLKPRKLAYAVDATLSGPSRTVHYRSLAKLAMLPTQAAPLLIFLGVDDTGNNAVFLVDSTLSVVAGEGTCKASNENCATLSLEPGQVEVFTDGQGNRYELGIDQIRLVSAASAARAQAKRLAAARQSAAHVSGAPLRRFVPPMITDLFLGASS